MRDDSTVRLNAGAAAPDGDPSPVAGTVALPAAAGGEGAAGVEATAKVPPPAAEAGHVAGPGLVLPAAAREPRGPFPVPDGRPTMPPRSGDHRTSGDPVSDGGTPGDRGAPAPTTTQRLDAPTTAVAAAPAAERRGTPDRGPGPAARADAAGPRPPESPAAPASVDRVAPVSPPPPPPARAPHPPPRPGGTPPSAPRRPGAPPPPHRAPRPVTPPSARPRPPVPGATRPAGSGPGRPAAAPSPPRSAAAGPSRATHDPPSSSRSAGRGWRRAGGVLGGLVLGLVAILAATWTLLVPPGGPEGRADERPAAAPARPAAPSVRWVRTNGDEFDGAALDRRRWNVYNSIGGFGNGLRRPSAVTQGDGLLTITARPRVNGGTSGGISMGKGQLHGRWEFRVRADPGVGYSPAVLLWPDSERFPIDGELDMLEAPNGDRRTASAYVHYGADNKTRGAEVKGDFTQWHTFAFEWLPDRLTWYVDGQKAWEVTDRTVIPTKPMHLCIQLDQGPAVKFMPGPDASTPDQVRMQVDWARQYKVG